MANCCDVIKCKNEPKWLVKLRLHNLSYRKYKVCDNCRDELKHDHGNFESYAILTPLPIINRSFEKFKCQTCKRQVLLPELKFRGPEVPAKVVDVFCVQCSGVFTVQVPPVGDVGVFRHEPTFVFPDDIAGVSATGVKTTTDIYVKFNGIESCYEARVGIAIMGTMNFPSMAGACVFDPNYLDNYVIGKGASPAAAVKVMVEELKKIADGLWA